MEPYGVSPFVIGLFPLACLQGSSMLQHMSETPFFLSLNNIPLNVYTICCLSIHPSMDIWAASNSGYCAYAAEHG